MSLHNACIDASWGNVAELLWRAAATNPLADAIVQCDCRVTYGSLRDRASAIAERLRAGGVSPGDRVALLQERSADAAATIFGIAALGAVAVCINDKLRARQMEHMLRHSGARTLVTTREMLARNARALDTDADIVDVSAISLLPGSDVAPVDRVGDDLVQIIYTSGSTGLPKGVCFTHGNLRAGVEIVTSYLGLRDTDRVASLLGFSSVYGLNQLIARSAANRRSSSRRVHSLIPSLPCCVSKQSRCSQRCRLSGLNCSPFQIFRNPSTPCASCRTPADICRRRLLDGFAKSSRMLGSSCSTA